MSSHKTNCHCVSLSAGCKTALVGLPSVRTTIIEVMGVTKEYCKIKYMFYTLFYKQIIWNYFLVRCFTEYSVSLTVRNTASFLDKLKLNIAGPKIKQIIVLLTLIHIRVFRTSLQYCPVTVVYVMLIHHSLNIKK